jgi:hypothetical protein
MAKVIPWIVPVALPVPVLVGADDGELHAAQIALAAHTFATTAQRALMSR